MDDGNPLPSVEIFLLFILLDAIFYGFGAAIQNVNTNDLEHPTAALFLCRKLILWETMEKKEFSCTGTLK